MSLRDRIAVIGVGDDGLEGLGKRARQLVRGAEMLCGGKRHLSLFNHPTAEQVKIDADLDGLIGRLETEMGKQKIVVLASGDPCFFGIGPLLAHHFGRDRVEIIPGVSAIALAFGRIGQPWHDAVVASAHGRPLGPAIRRIARARRGAILTDAVNNPAKVATALLAAGVEDCPAYVFEHLGGPSERTFEGKLSDVARRQFGQLNLVVVCRQHVADPDQRIGRLESELAHSGGLVTKAEVRAISLSKLRLRPDGVLWDVGAGCGSVSVEAAGLMPDGSIFAVERSPEQISMLEQNVQSFGRQSIVTTVADPAPEALARLPDPSSVFVGGSGGRLVEILDVAHERIDVGGAIVANLATIEHVAACAAWGDRHGAPTEVVEVQISRSAGIRGLTRFVAQNPVFVVTMERQT